MTYWFKAWFHPTQLVEQDSRQLFLHTVWLKQCVPVGLLVRDPWVWRQTSGYDPHSVVESSINLLGMCASIALWSCILSCAIDKQEGDCTE